MKPSKINQQKLGQNIQPGEFMSNARERGELIF